MRAVLVTLCLILICASVTLEAQEVFGVINIDASDTGTLSPGQGTGFAVWSSDRTTLSYRITYNNIQGSFSGAHFHSSVNSGVLQPITFIGKTAEGTWTLPDSVKRLLTNEGVYVNIHTSTATGGEISGRVQLRQSGFAITLDGAQASTSSLGKGTGYAELTGGGGSTDVTYRMTYAGMSAARTLAHFHALPNGGVVHDIGPSFTDSTADGFWSAAPDSVVAKFFRGQIYLNVHSSAAPGGEIRGFARFIGEYATYGLLTGGAAGTASTALGTSWAVLRPSLDLHYSATYQGLQGTFQNAHFHRLPSTNVAKAVTFANGFTSGIWSALTDQDLADVVAGRIYLNIHSSTATGGEIRSDMEPSTQGMVMASLDGAQAGTASTGKGTVWAYFLDDSVAYSLTFTGLQGTYQNSHFHLSPGGSVLSPIVPAFNNTAIGFWNPGVNFYDLVHGDIYVNIHSSTASGGEIRGNLKLGTGIATSVEPVSSELPESFALAQNYPNPFNPSTTIDYTISHAGRTTLTVFNLLGQKMATLLDGVSEPGTYRAVFDASQLPSGVYLYRLSVESGSILTRRMVLLK